MDKETVQIAYATDKNFIFYTYISIYSLMLCSNKDRNYEITILLDFEINNIDVVNAYSELEKNFKNLKIKFINVTNYFSDSFGFSSNYSIVTYYRAYLPILKQEIKKILYIDSDTIIKRDVSELYDIDISDKSIAAIHEPVKYLSNKNNYFHYFCKNVINKTGRNKFFESYFNAGVIVMNLDKLRSNNFTEEFLSTYKKFPSPPFVDQDILNVIFDKNEIKYISLKWNMLYHIALSQERLNEGLGSDYKKKYLEAYNDPYIIHYASSQKPWKNPCIPLANEFWKIARNTQFYEKILYRMMKGV